MALNISMEQTIAQTPELYMDALTGSSPLETSNKIINIYKATTHAIKVPSPIKNKVDFFKSMPSILDYLCGTKETSTLPQNVKQLQLHRE
jgi:hypothetical protein